MTRTKPALARPNSRLLRWLTDPGLDVPREIGDALLGELFSSPGAVIAGVVNSMVLNGAAILMHGGGLFVMLMAMEVVIGGGRIVVARRCARGERHAPPHEVDLCLVMAIAWCALQGVTACAALRSGIAPLQVLSATTIMGLIGPLSARNYGTPRLALLLICLCDLPFVLGAVLSGELWLLILAVQTPLFLFGTWTIIRRFQTLAVSALVAERQSRQHALQDPLTGLSNRRGVDEMLDEFSASPERTLALLYVDLDHFKPINDTYGHACGDAVLQIVARRLCSIVRPDDMVARLGGDEFAIIAPDLTPAAAAFQAERIIRHVVGQPISVGDVGPLRVGMSIGFACAPQDGPAGHDLQKKADLALYEAKAAGRGVPRGFPDVTDRQPAVEGPITLAG